MVSKSKSLLFLVLLLFMALFTRCTKNEKWTSLLTDDFSGDWETYIGPSFDSLSNKFDGDAAGLNNDPMKVFSISRENDEPILKVSGENFGGISTKREFENYHLSLDFKWGTKKYHPKKKDKRDSGLLYHAGGEHGADFGFWMRSQEFQIQEGDCGDYWGVAGGSFEVPAFQKDSGNFVYAGDKPLMLFNDAGPNGRRCIKNPDAEKVSGEWNTLELYCLGDTAVHVVNGKVVMVLYKSGYLQNGSIIPLRKGKIQLQSEGAEVYYKHIKLRNIKEIPATLLTDSHF
jgi:Domain of Unknown Function (DUF1080)